MSDQKLLVLIVPALRGDEIVDLLMACQDVEGFTRSPVAGFSREHSRFSLREAVQGHVDQMRFEIVAGEDVLSSLREQLGALAGRDRFFFYSLALWDSGYLAVEAGDDRD